MKSILFDKSYSFFNKENLKSNFEDLSVFFTNIFSFDILMKKVENQKPIKPLINSKKFLSNIEKNIAIANGLNDISNSNTIKDELKNIDIQMKNFEENENNLKEEEKEKEKEK